MHVLDVNCTRTHTHTHSLTPADIIQLPPIGRSLKMSHNANMIPKISVTTYHNSKYNNILEDTISQLQNIRESIQIIAPSFNARYPPDNGSTLLFGATPICQSLPDLTANSNWSSVHVPPAARPHSMYNGVGRRRSWAAVEKSRIFNKSDSISSLDSQSRGDNNNSGGSRAAVAPKRRSNSTVGTIVVVDAGTGTGAANSTHSLNDAKYFFEFERQQDKLNELSMMHCRLPLQKSISTPSIPPACEHAKEDGGTAAVTRHFSDTDEENLDERSRLCVKEKTEVDHPEKRRKRGSLFFRKKKDKSKSKATTPKHCDDCSNASGGCAEHTYEALAKSSMKQIQITKSSSKKSSDNSQPRPGDSFKDLTDGGMSHHHHGDHTIFADDAVLLHYEFLNEAHLMAHHLDDDAVLGIGRETEHDTWSPRVGADILKQLTAKQIKRQEHIYELIITEKRHCQILCLMQKVFVDSLQQHFGTLNIDRLFPRLADLMRLHKGFLKQLRLRQDTHPIVESIADILLEFFSGPAAAALKSAYGEFCSNHQAAVDLFKYFQSTDARFATWHKHKQTNPLLKRKGIPECTLFVVQRLTKYPILIEDQLKLTKDNGPEREKLLRANALIKDILVDVNAQVAQKENDDRHLDIFKRIEAKSATVYRGEKFKKSDIIRFGRKLKFEGVATLMHGRSKMQTVNVIVLSDCLFFLQENSDKFQFFTPEKKAAGVVPLQKLFIREKATESRGIYMISALLSEMFDLKVQHPKDKQVWIQAIRSAVLNCPMHVGGGSPGSALVMGANGVAMTSEEQQQQQDEGREVARRELIAAMRMNDMEHAILLEQKIAVQANYLRELGMPLAGGGGESSAETYLAQFGSYRHLLGSDESSTQCDTVDLTRRAVNTVQEIGTLTGTLYRTATGVDLPLRVASLNVAEMAVAGGVGRKGMSVGGGSGMGIVGVEHLTYSKHPSRAETFSGFDEKMSKLISPWRDAVVSSLTNTMNHSSSSHSHNDSNSSHASNTADSPRSSIGSSNATTSTNAASAGHNSNNHSGPATNAAGSPTGANSSAHRSTSVSSSLDTVTLRHVASRPATAQDHHNALLVAHHLHALLAVVHQQMSTIAALQHELRDHSKSLYRHDLQLEELRNLQDKFQEEKTGWLRQRDAQEAELNARVAEQRVQQQRMHDEQEDIREQREQLFRKMEKMERLSAAAAALGADGPSELGSAGSALDSVEAAHAQLQQYHQQQHLAGESFIGGGIERRSSNKERMSSHSKLGHSFSNVPKPNVHAANVKQTLPLKLSSSKSDKTTGHNPFSPTSAGSAAVSVAQMLPLKLADRKGKPSTPSQTSNHTRTGSSPAIVQQHTPTGGVLTSPTTASAGSSSSNNNYAGRYDDRSRASRRSDTALIPNRLATMSSATSTPTGRMASGHYAATLPSTSTAAQQQQQLQHQQQQQLIYQHQLLQQQQLHLQQQQQQQQQQLARPSSAAAAATSSAASQQEEIYF